jgi:hypothetical protein
VPDWLGKRAGADPEENPAAIYVWRLFGVRTIYLAAEIVLAKGDHLRDAVRIAPVIHASDALTAAAAGKAGRLSEKAARMATIISSVNFVLAVVAALAGGPKPGPLEAAKSRAPWRR